MQIFDKGKIYNFMGMRWIMFIISAILFFGSIGLLFTKGLSYGIDFAGGTSFLRYNCRNNMGEKK